MTGIVNVKNIIMDLQEKGVISSNQQDIDRMKSGTTDGLVYTLLEKGVPKYVLKLDDPKNIQLTEQFFHMYQHVNLLPKIFYIDPKKEYILYSYIAGTTHYNRGSKLEWLTLLVKELFNHYEQYDQNANWGRLGGIPRQTWYEFNSCSLESAYINIGSLLPNEDYQKVKSIVERIALYEKQEMKYLLHGDTGVHNFVFDNNAIVGIIDPSPLIGPIIYDFTYAFCSSPDDLNLETLFNSFALLKQVTYIEKTQLIEEVIFQLYTRIGVCVKVHPHDLEDYLKAWTYWRSLMP
ncbi:phosphotransferase [Lysinibacillus piscis]|uniref:Aminoglycoside phosphotransferase n=1 Tax=Lysinibacillus piscis TaxID=2518931 RepID=A0ABQ5NMH3_9BACI|nr:phosphotransferase [Lysinibacillus sp. KH24]GLC89224.1 aminoglycoside phosphotransferase [Lysinibacillus sp. KH24]